jgi:hypothetical protein
VLFHAISLHMVETLFSDFPPNVLVLLSLVHAMYPRVLKGYINTDHLMSPFLIIVQPDSTLQYSQNTAVQVSHGMREGWKRC